METPSINTSFETQYIPADLCESLISYAVGVFGIVLLVVAILIALRLIFKKKIQFPFSFILKVPKLLVSLLLFVLIFCYDYTTRKCHLPNFDNMLISTFAVGFLALCELLDAIVGVFQDALNIINDN